MRHLQQKRRRTLSFLFYCVVFACFSMILFLSMTTTPSGDRSGDRSYETFGAFADAESLGGSPSVPGQEDNADAGTIDPANTGGGQTEKHPAHGGPGNPGENAMPDGNAIEEYPGIENAWGGNTRGDNGQGGYAPDGDAQGENAEGTGLAGAESGEGAQALPGGEEGAGSIDPDLWKESFSPVPVSLPVDESYFSDALFIGDSRVMGLMLYSGLTGATFYSEKGINVSTLLTKPIVMQTGGTKITVMEALKSRQFGKIYIKTGINELGWRSVAQFTEAYAEVIDRIKELQPGAAIYVQSILPVSQKKSTDGGVYTNPRIIEFNEMLKKMTWEKGVHYLDVFQSLVNDEGNLPDGAGSDGIHLNKEYCQIWLSYLKQHAVSDGISFDKTSVKDAERGRG